MKYNVSSIAAMLVLLVAVACNIKPKEVADAIYTNGKIYTVDASNEWAQAVAIKNGKFIKVGSTEDVKAFKGNKTKIVDLKGKFIMPGIIDEHIHPDMGADNYMNVFITVDDSWEEITGKLKAFRKNNPNKKWIFGSTIDWLKDNNGIIVNYGLPSNKKILDEIIDDRPVALYDQGAHAMLLNSAAFKELGVDNNTPDPEGGTYVKDDKGELTGVVRETACLIVTDALDNASDDEWTQKGLLPFLNEMTSYGVTGLNDTWSLAKNSNAYLNLEKEGKLDHWINLCLTSPLEMQGETKKQEQKDFIANYKVLKSDQVNPTTIKYVLDGSAAGQTAAMIEPFEGTDFNGDLRLNEDELEKDITYYANLGFAVKAHAVGDRGIRLLLDIFEKTPKPTKGAMNSIAHSTFVHPDDIERYAQTNTVYEASPPMWYPNGGVPIIRKDIGEERLSHGLPINKVVETGAVVSYGSDWTVSASPSPWIGFETIITRQLPGGSEDAVNPQYAVNLETAIKIFTLNGATAIGIQDKTGSIENGKSADFIVLEQNPFEVSTYKLHKTKVNTTVFRGKEVYKAK
ncbi:MAG: amidohydrolase [Bacteroidales bacterium]|nr:amidohydrolase [Bacteroidales bacterium]